MARRKWVRFLVEPESNVFLITPLDWPQGLRQQAALNIIRMQSISP